MRVVIYVGGNEISMFEDLFRSRQEQIVVQEQQRKDFTVTNLTNVLAATLHSEEPTQHPKSKQTTNLGDAPILQLSGISPELLLDSNPFRLLRLHPHQVALLLQLTPLTLFLVIGSRPDA